MQGGAIGLAYAGPEIRLPPKMRAQQLAACLDCTCFTGRKLPESSAFVCLLITVWILTVPYEPVRATFTTERCGVCRWVEDYDYNKMIVCNRYLGCFDV